MDGNVLTNSELDTVLIKVASRCNINCKYCYVFNMGDDNWSRQEKLMSDETLLGICNSLYALKNTQKKPFSIVLHGGEPLLLGSLKLAHFLNSIRNFLPSNYPISIQTNGVLITNDILDICSEYKVTVAVSIDGPKHIHDKSRVTHKGAGTFEDVLKGIKKLKLHSDANFLNTGLLAVIDPFSDPGEVYYFFKSLTPPSVDFLYRDGNHTNLPSGKSSLYSTEYGSWMAALLDIYLNDPDPLPIRVLDDMMKVILGGLVSKEGLGLTDFGIIIIDTDGTIMKNDTLKSTYNGADKFARDVNIKDGTLLEFLNSQEFAEYRQMQKPSCTKCTNCPELDICGGGMILHRWKVDAAFNNPSVYCVDQLHLIKNMRKSIAELYHTYA